MKSQQQDEIEQAFLPIARPSTGPEEVEAVRQVLESGWLTQGPFVSRFEKAFAARHGATHALAVTSCTTALHLALVVLGIGPGDEVIIPAFTWVATANVVVHCGATPVFVDVDPISFNVEPAAVRAALTARTKAVIAVHLFGRVAPMDELRVVIPASIPIIEDAACATGASDQGRPAGSLGVMGCFSLHPRKTVTCGEGGVVTTNDGELALLLDTYRNHGASIPEEVRHRGARPWELPEFKVFGFNYRMTDIQAAVAEVQLRKLDRFLEERRALAALYDDRLKRIEWLKSPDRPDHMGHSLQAYVATVDSRIGALSRNRILEVLQENKIGARPGTHAVVALEAYRSRFGVDPQRFPGALEAESQSIALPLHNEMGASDIERVVQVLENAA
ncbi:DegT/DnrJ/EryC1/StrS family aminotransferase [Bradyrhizobium sp. AUGA SZCCT0274]|uniref:DegT/DnrJ/EryC1/StrS family aminotransferase n=1 Tax=Bradyrhizobium sp. AUGA SZCCT0274 TaxID=2807670 RepID=UPI001BA61390|nr:DegT/DnrJ/EryC1/StrS family aminotransferase [Bradyrhizobium sp. AUGA SZCCT0274]MBR1244204.1 DegT/DnrJ/EryC1/StrS family aminotransferase [Bradyrhizobium sp. AUGA SZCCT0274]